MYGTGLGKKRCSSFYYDFKVSQRGGGLRPVLKQERHLLQKENLGSKGTSRVKSERLRNSLEV